ncbi:hypothetical protein P4475_17220 [Halalkalibacterium halodurans]|uniref:hypothetical protein n=1 Tax=Halalkalibacterium halodurans TaxID=86665 RepID=UPI002E207776|nr:hypothetical protein [Halalkalibacterium halodurans]
MKRLFSFIVIGLVAVALVGCGETESSASAKEAEESYVENFNFEEELGKVKNEIIRSIIEDNSSLTEAFINDKEFREQLQNAETAMDHEVVLSKYWHIDNDQYLEAMGFSEEEIENIKKENVEIPPSVE